MNFTDLKESLPQALALALEAGGADLAKISLKIRDRFPELTPFWRQVVVDTASARISGGKLLSFADSWFVTSRILPQATRPQIAGHHAAAFKGAKHVLEIGTGLGVDTFFLSKATTKVTSIEADANLADLARLNLQINGCDNVAVITGTAQNIIPDLQLQDFDALWADPARRTGEDRVTNPTQYSPPLEYVLSITISGVCGVKVAPGAELNRPIESVEFLGFGDECLEKTLWRNRATGPCLVSLVDKNVSWAPSQPSEPTLVPPANLPGAFLIEPHDVLIASGHLSSFLFEYNFNVVDRRVAYASSLTKPSPSPWYRTFKIHEVFPFSAQSIQKSVTAHRWNRLTEIKKRAFAETPEALRSKLELPDPSVDYPDCGVIFMTRFGDAPWAIIASRVDR